MKNFKYDSIFPLFLQKTLNPNIKRTWFRTGGVAQVIERLRSKQKILSSNPNTIKKKKRTWFKIMTNNCN
jgi:hypothetical protein